MSYETNNNVQPGNNSNDRSYPSAVDIEFKLDWTPSLAWQGGFHWGQMAARQVDLHVLFANCKSKQIVKMLQAKSVGRYFDEWAFSELGCHLQPPDIYSRKAKNGYVKGFQKEMISRLRPSM